MTDIQYLTPEGAAALKEEQDGQSSPHVLFLCDRSHSFRTINTVIKAAGLAGYPNFQFGVLEEKQ